MASRKCTWGEEIQARAVGRQLWQCAVITGKSRMTRLQGWKIIMGASGNYVQGWDKRTNLDGRRYRDRFRAFSYHSPGQILWMVGQGGLAFALHRGTAANPDWRNLAGQMPLLETVQSMVPGSATTGIWMHAACCRLQRGVSKAELCGRSRSELEASRSSCPSVKRTERDSS